MTDSIVERVVASIEPIIRRGAPIYDLAIEEVARAAIEAMREPTQKMTDAVLLGDLDSWVLEENWRAMIDAALAEPVTK